MFIKKLEYPVQLTSMKAVLRRLSATHPKRSMIEDEYVKRAAGYRGEKEVAKQLKRLPNQDYYILHDVRLMQGNLPFQIDVLVISTSCILIIEVKNMYGTLFFDTHFKQMIRTTKDVEEGFRNPLTQVNYHREQLQQWLETHGFGCPPIECLVAIGNPSTVLKTNAQVDDSIFQKVLHAENLIDQIVALQKKHPSMILPNSLIKEIIKNDTPYQQDILSYFNLDKKDIVTGVECPVCSSIPMRRCHGKWVCPTCKTISRSAHVQAIKDFLLLISPTISNRQCCAFLHLASSNTTNYLLTSMNLVSQGNTKGRIYRLPN